MNNLLLFMSLCGSTSLITYYLLRFLFKDKLVHVYRYRLLKMTIAFFLLPIPLLTHDVRNIVRLIFQNENLFSLQLQPGEVYREDLSKIFFLTEEGIVFPRYSNVFLLLIFIWFLILVLLVGIQIYNYKELKRRILSTSTEIAPTTTSLDEKYDKILQKRHVTLRVSPDIRSSFTYGLFNPVIVISDTINCNERKCIVKHELTHVNSMDFITRGLCLLTVALHFYNPLVYLLFREISNVSELQCDEKM